MKSRSRIRLWGLCIFLFLVVQITIAQQVPEYVPNRVIVKFKKTITASNKEKLKVKVNGKIKTKFKLIDAELWELEGVSVQEALQNLKNDKDIEYIEPDYIWSINQVTPNDPSFSQLWGMHNTGQTGGTTDADIDAPEAWGIDTGGNVLVGVIDTGVDYNHVDLASNIWTNPNEIPNNNIDDDGNGFVDDVRGWDFVNNDNDPMDDHYHGTHCAGTIAGIGNNGVGVVGVSWTAKILPIKFLNSSGSGTSTAAILSVEYATMMGVNLTSNSWGGGGYSQGLYDAIEAAGIAGQLFIAAAGNESSNNDLYPHYPSSYDSDNIIAVASTDHNDNMSSFSCYGQISVDLGAPGSNIYSTSPGNSYRTLSGTSMATPHVAGAATLIWSYVPSLTASQIKNLIMDYADPIPALTGRCISESRLNVYESIIHAEPDLIDPDPVIDLAVVGNGSNWLDLEWTATGDDGSIGNAYAYDIRYSTSLITAGNFDSALQFTNPPSPGAPGTVENCRVDGLDFNTTYYIALKVLDEQNNISTISNVPFGTTLGIPDIRVTPTALSESLLTGATSDQILTIYNDAVGTLEFSFPDFGATALLSQPGIQTNPSSANISRQDYGKNEVDPREGYPVILGAGGPDLFGYRWIDSNEPGGPVFQWQDISSTGTLVTGLSDDNYVGPFPVGFNFPFYGNTQTQFYIQSNGVINFNSVNISLSNQPIPTQDSYNHLIAWCWDDLYPRGAVYYQNLGDRLIIQFQDYGEYSYSGLITAQVVLYPNGRILLQYLNTQNGFDTNGCTIGIENQTGSDGLQVAFNTPYIEDSLAVHFSYLGDWLSLSPVSGTVTAGSSMDVTVTFDASNLEAGDYTEDMICTSNDPDESSITIPADLHVTGAPDIVVDQDTLNFGSLFLGGTEIRTLVVSNNGTDVLNVTSITSDESDYSPDISSFSLTPWNSESIVVTFNPSAVGVITGTLTIVNDDPDEGSYEVHLMGEGLEPPDIAVIPDSLHADLLSDETETQILTIDNSSGQSDLHWEAAPNRLTTTEEHSYTLTQPKANPMPNPEGSYQTSVPIRTTAITEDLADLTGIHILYDQSHGQSFYSSVLFSDLTSRGATIIQNTSPLTASLLSGYHVLYTKEVGIVFTSQEIDDISSWVNAGGAILFEGDQSATAFNDLLIGLNAGILFSSSSGQSGTTTNIYPHETTENVTQINIGGNLAYLSTVSSPALRLVDDISGQPNTACSQSGSGRIVAMADENFEDYTIGYADNQLFANQVFDWLAMGGISWLSVSPESGSVAAGGSQDVDVIFDATDMNGGDYSAHILISSNDPDESELIVPATLSVTGIPDISLDAVTLDFGSLFMGATDTLTLMVTNVGTDLLSISDISSNHGDYTSNI
ncbi:S8 family serine peptidase, partial [bacterium]